MIEEKKMLKIKFSENYPKLWNQTTGELLAVKVVESSNLHEDLIEYDTKNSKGNYYPLPKTTLLQLIFLGDKGIPFCTLRRLTHRKFVYYQNSVGKSFNIIIGGQTK